MRPGQLDERVTISQPTTVVDAYNEPGEGYTSIGTFWASWKPSKGNERQQAEKTEGSLDGMFTVRRSTATKAITHRHKVTRNNGDVYMVAGTPTYSKDRSLYMMLPARMVTNA